MLRVAGGNLHRKTLSGLWYYAAVLLRGGRVCRPLVLVTLHSQSTGRTLCIVLYTHFRSINVLSLSLSTWSCDIHPQSCNDKLQVFFSGFSVLSSHGHKMSFARVYLPSSTSQLASSTITQNLYAAPDDQLRSSSRSPFRCWILYFLFVCVHSDNQHVGISFGIEINTITAYCGHNTDPGFSVHIE